jgi:gluconate kinase
MQQDLLPSPAAARWVIMGVCGCGKSEVGRRLAAALDVRFLEGDAFHPPQNVAKMAAGIPLTDADRAGWLDTLREQIAAAQASGEGLVLAYMPLSLLDSQLRDLEPLAADEAGVLLDIGNSPDVLIEQILHPQGR